MSKILIIDLETTGFTPKSAFIVEIGIVELDLNTGEKKIIFDNVCWEKGITKEISDNSWIIKNSTLTTEMIRTSKSLDSLKPEIQNIINKYPLGVTAFNNTFDFGFMDDRGFIFPKKLDCPMKLSTNICKILGKRGYKWPSVQEAYEYFFGKTDYIETHRGADDAFHEADIVYQLYKIGIFKIE